ncbi:shikimate dehydrogenase [bacterium]|nr:shikimate dehydrogenase [bacterium]
MNPELYERYLAKKAKKLGISVEELKAQGAANQTGSQATKPEGCRADVWQFNDNNIEKTDLKPQSANSNTSIPSYLHTSNNALSPSVKDNRENKFALIGYPLGHSLSKVIHEAGFKSMGISAVYDILETPPETLVDRIKYLKNNGYKGFNVTIPLKLPVSLFVNDVDRYANLAGAINTVYINEDKTLVGYNTDVIGFKNAIPFDIDLSGKRVGILGTGGAAHAACVALSECGVNTLDFFTRSIPNSIELMNYVRRIFPSITFNVYQIENIRNLCEYDMLVNTTPIGMLGKSGDMTPVEEDALRTLKQGAIVYDVIYNPKKTVLIKLAEKLGYRTITGLDMLIHQAVSAQKIWLGGLPDFKDMKISALEAL